MSNLPTIARVKTEKESLPRVGPQTKITRSEKGNRDGLVEPTCAEVIRGAKNKVQGDFSQLRQKKTHIGTKRNRGGTELGRRIPQGWGSQQTNSRWHAALKIRGEAIEKDEDKPL